MKPDDLLHRARGLVPVLGKRAEATDRDRRILSETMKDLHEAGLFRALQPARYGGLECGLDTFVRVVDEIGRGCGATAWVYSVLAMHQWHIGMFPEQAQNDVWKTTPDALASSSYRPSGGVEAVEGGYKLSGTWGFASGCDNTQWTIMGGKIEPGNGDAPLHQCFFLVPRADYKIEDNWHVLGLSGTGSKNLVIEEAFVPAHRVLTVAQAGSGAPPGAAVNPGLLFRIPFLAAVQLCLCSPLLGMAHGALDHYIEALRTWTTKGTFSGPRLNLAELPTIQLRTAEAAASIDAARLLLLRVCSDTQAAMVPNAKLTPALRIRNRRDHAFAVRLLVRAVDQLYESVGTNGLFDDNPIQREWRNVHAGAMHITNNWDAAGTLYGRFALGLEPGGSSLW